jgi:hypothetical protein
VIRSMFDDPRDGVPRRTVPRRLLQLTSHKSHAATSYPIGRTSVGRRIGFVTKIVEIKRRPSVPHRTPRPSRT